MHETEAVLFDLDGTLVDSMWVWTDIDIVFLGRYHYELPDDLQGKIEGMGFTETAEYFKKRFSLPLSIDEIKDEWNSLAMFRYANEVRLKPGAADFLHLLRKKGIKTAIASSNSRELIQACLVNNQVEDCFDNITISCDVPRGKPSPDVYLLAARQLEVSPENCLVFEDVPMGIRAGKNAGMRVCAVEDAYASDRREEIRRLADYYIRSFDEIAGQSFEVLR